jgi:hypothetical protein
MYHHILRSLQVFDGKIGKGHVDHASKQPGILYEEFQLIIELDKSISQK